MIITIVDIIILIATGQGFLLTALITSNEILMTELEDFQFSGFPVRLIIFNWVIITLIISCLLAIACLLRKHSKRLEDLFSSPEKIKLDWLRYICYMEIIAWSIFFVENILSQIKPHRNIVLKI
ncbi:hypothetical protein GF337_00600 [candidate division KSB1 bacterium]|nr:hypothetical protein [candidate division KSB1 bacterium]